MDALVEAAKAAIDKYRLMIEEDRQTLQASIERVDRERLTQAQTMIRIHRHEGAITGLLDLMNSLESTLFVEDD